MASRAADLASISKADDEERRSPVDLAHLSRQAGGSRPLEREVLKLFLRYSATQFDRLETARREVERREAAHAILGSALGVGAMEVARIAGEIEEGPEASGKIEALAAALDDARRFISAYLGE